MKPICIFAKESNGGAGTFLRDLSKIKSIKYVQYFYLYKKNPHLNINRFNVINNNYPSDFNFSIKKFFISIKSIFKTIIILYKNRPKIIFATDQYAAIILLISRIFFVHTVKTIILVNNNVSYAIKEHSNRLYQLLIKCLIIFLFPLATKIIFVSEEQQRTIVQEFYLDISKTKVIYPGVRRIKTEVKKTERKKAKYQIISVGRLDRQKDFQTIIFSLHELKKIYPSFELHIIGDGPLKKDLLRLSKDLNMNKQIHFLKWKKNVFKFLSTADIFVFASRYEGFPYVITEAMSCGLPIVATNCSFGIKESLSNGKCGLIIGQKNYKQMAKAIFRLISNKKLRTYYSIQALEKSKNFALELMLQEYRSLYDSLIN